MSQGLTLDHAAGLANAVYEEDPRTSHYEVVYDNSSTSAINVGFRYVIYKDATGNLTVAFKGTSEPLEMLADSSVAQVENPYGDGLVHHGFLASYQFMRNDLNVQLTLAQSKYHGSLTFTGHSLGGALAVMAASDVGDDFGVDRMVTFGAPAVGNAAFNDTISDSIDYSRVVNGKDAVAMALDGKLGYVQSGKLVQLDHSTVLWSVSQHSMTGYVELLKEYDSKEDMRLQAENEEKWNRFHNQIIKQLGDVIVDGKAARLTIGGTDLFQMARQISDAITFTYDAERGRLIYQFPSGTFWKAFTDNFGSGELLFLGRSVSERRAIANIANVLVGEQVIGRFEAGLNSALGMAQSENETVAFLTNKLVRSIENIGFLGDIIDDAALSVRLKLVEKLGGVGEFLSKVPGAAKMATKTLMKAAVLAQAGMVAFEEYQAFREAARDSGLIDEVAEHYRMSVKQPFLQLSQKYVRGEISDDEFAEVRVQCKAARDMYIVQMNFLLSDRASAKKLEISALDITGLGLMDALADVVVKDDFSRDEVLVRLNAPSPMYGNVDDYMESKFIEMYGEALWYNEDTEYWRIHQPVLSQLAHRLRTGTYTMADRATFGIDGDISDHKVWDDANAMIGATSDFDSDTFDDFDSDSAYGNRKRAIVADLQAKGFDADMTMSMDELIAMEHRPDEPTGTLPATQWERENGPDYVGGGGAHPWHYSAGSDPLFFIHREFRYVYLDGYSIHALARLEKRLGLGNTYHDYLTRPTKRARYSDSLADPVTSVS